MSEITDFRKIQQRTQRLFSFEDGLWDLLLGMIFMSLAIYPVTRELLGPEWNIVLFLGVLAILVVGQLAIRRAVSIPRLGYARPNRSPKMKLLLVFTVMMVLITFALVLVTLLSPAVEPAVDGMTTAATSRSYLVEWIVILVMGGLFSAIAYIFGVARVYAYGWMLGLANLVSVYMEHNAGWTFQLPSAIAAGVILAVGIAYLTRFLRKYPLSTQEA